MRLGLSSHAGFGAFVAALWSTALASGPGRAVAGPVLPDFSPGNFTSGAPIDNLYFPLVPGTTFRYSANVTDPATGERVHEVDVDVVTNQTQMIAGVVARVVHARSFEDDVLVEDTSDFYAQDKSGNVWYLGEATSAFERDDEGNIISTSHAGSWRAGVNGGKPGYIMPAAALRRVGFEHYQEFAPADQAVD